jgi:hypothetical protein
MFMMMLQTTKRTSDTMRATPAPYLISYSGVASEKMKMAMMRAE